MTDAGPKTTSRTRGRATRPAAADALALYETKRDFAASPEPRGRGRRAKAPRFVVQKHAARRLHYDFRLEIDGVLKSWAVTRGPSLVVGERRLAVETEDHPLSYLDFEGVIPKGQYGGGSVIVWDIGTFAAEGDAAADHAAGKLTFTLKGERLRGRWHLVRTRPRGGKPQWLMLKADDAEARAPGAPDVLDAETSVMSGRTNAELEAGGVLRRDHAARETIARTVGARLRRLTTTTPAAAKSALLPVFVEPCLATLAAAAPTAAGWLHEIKFDGYRLQARIDGKAVKLLTRSGLDWTDRFAPIARALLKLGLPSGLIDGEVVVEDAAGVSSFSKLQAALDGGQGDALRYYAFDLLYLDGRDLRPLPLRERKAALAEALAAGGGAAVTLSQHIDDDGEALARHACRLGLEGIVSKRADSPYRSGRGRDWLKIKCVERQEFVVAGYAPSSVVRGAIGTLVLGVTADDGALVHVGRVGTGFSAEEARRLQARLDPLRRPDAPFAAKPSAEAARGGVRWVEPRLVVEVELRGWTGDGNVRHAAYRGLREDKPPAEVRRETANPPAESPAAHDPDMHASLTHPDRVLWPDVGLTKAGLADFYGGIAGWLLPQVAGRPLSLVRGPAGAQGKLFFQKHAWAGLDEAAVTRLTLGDDEALAIHDINGILALVQANVLEIHPWGATAADAERPDRLVFDLDPGEGVGWGAVVEGAAAVRERLRAMKHESYVKTTGGKGLHVVVPLKASAGWTEAKAFAAGLAEAMAADEPRRFTATLAKRARDGRIFVDYLRNGRGSTAVAAYSTRARPGAPVATPVGWDELAGLAGGDAFRVGTLARRLDHLARDPWADMARTARPLAARGSAGRKRKAKA